MAEENNKFDIFNKGVDSNNISKSRLKLTKDIEKFGLKSGQIGGMVVIENDPLGTNEITGISQTDSSWIGKKVILHNTAKIENSYIEGNVIISDNAKIINSEIRLNSAVTLYIGGNTVIENSQIIVDKPLCKYTFPQVRYYILSGIVKDIKSDHLFSCVNDEINSTTHKISYLEAEDMAKYFYGVIKNVILLSKTNDMYTGYLYCANEFFHGTLKDLEEELQKYNKAIKLL